MKQFGFQGRTRREASLAANSLEMHSILRPGAEQILSLAPLEHTSSFLDRRSDDSRLDFLYNKAGGKRTALARLQTDLCSPWVCIHQDQRVMRPT